MQQERINQLNLQIKNSNPEEILAYFLKDYDGKIALASSLSIEDQVLTHMMLSIDPKAKIFTLDTGRLFPETHEVLENTNKKYGINIEVYVPDAIRIERMVNDKGINLFYNSVEDRKFCCHVRKIEPLMRALTKLDAWVCGLRSEQSITRINVNAVEWDKSNGLLKINPLINWTEDQVWDYIKAHDIPYNKLHDEGFPSIGCQPCTRAIKPDEDIRAGRWWWEEPEKKECGLHVAK